MRCKHVQFPISLEPKRKSEDPILCVRKCRDNIEMDATMICVAQRWCEKRGKMIQHERVKLICKYYKPQGV